MSMLDIEICVEDRNYKHYQFLLALNKLRLMVDKVNNTRNIKEVQNGYKG